MADDGKPSFEQIRDAMMPPGANKDALWAALRSAHQTGGHVPGRPAPDISGAVPPEVAKVMLGLPADPFRHDAAPSIALAEMYRDFVEAGIPVASVERILGAMLACYGIMSQDET